MIDFFAIAERDLRQAHKPLPPSRDCEVCPKTAWLIADEVREERHVQSFICPNGHLKIVTEIA